MDRLKRLSLELQPISDNLFTHLKMAPPDPILGTAVAFKNDKNSEKINLGIGAYRDQNGKPYVFKSVQKVEKQILNSNFNKEYLPIEGSAEFLQGCKKLIFGKNSEVLKNKRVASCQTISGTGSLSLGFIFLSQFLPRIIYISSPTWLNHKNIIQYAKLKWVQYPYYDPKTKGFNCQAMLNFLSNAISGSVILLHACAHNPTGVDPTVDQWKQICTVMKKNSLIPFFDSAYQGYATGDLKKDAFPVRHFIEEGFQVIVSQSFSKNMGLYGERVGALHFVLNSSQTANKVLSQVKVIARQIYSSPPLHGALIAQLILNNKDNFQNWRAELRDTVALRIIKMRKALRDQLERIGTPGDWKHITDQIGMFSYTGLSQKQCELMISKYHIYLLKSGRISMAGINEKNVKYLANSIKSAIQQTL